MDQHTETVRDFDLGDVITAFTGRLVAPRGIPALYDILDHMTGDNLMTHQLPRAGRAMASVLLAQHPFLADITVPKITSEEEAMVFVAEMKLVYGDTVTCTSAEGEWGRQDPLAEMVEMVGAERVIGVTQ